MDFLPNELKCCKLTPWVLQEKTTVIYSQGQRATEFYYVKSGLIGLFHLLENGKESLLRIYQAGDYFGFRTLFSHDSYHCSAKVLKDVELDKIELHDLSAFITANPDFVHHLMIQLADELQDAEQRLAKASYTRSLDRVADSIMYLKKEFPEYAWTHREIAEFSGCETETEIRINQELKRKGII
ncbi:Crp/Fnr family transcriptional regulator [Lonepinella koalarum]|uniref:CRP-like cAMP-binding protein n=1 Tax=Lonepinella koalarum TaxID=53417 RepID=A0A4R1L1B6_9PAST|nr:Crp/Fnr family transcriptional regulator [Lonepinella koalarum]MDH2926696.1 cyclic nucleotide-binding protein [Lonepinella koalarum]TCK70643.1 CRP-like cAMP-binding protein [Lonepinella koalarum]TFJ89977.1 Crp/Fnr family transcriptional regulator [Lonepinella koalarum]